MPDYPTYRSERNFLLEQGAEVLELKNAEENAALIVVPSMQGRVMTSTASGDEGPGFGWINHDFIRRGVRSPQFNNFGGEERLWLGPEGGPFSLFFGKDREQVYENWVVPAAVDREAFEVVSARDQNISLRLRSTVFNAAGQAFPLQLGRNISLLNRNDLSEMIFVGLPDAVQCVAYRSDNILTNRGTGPWTRDRGLVSLWMSSMLRVSSSTFIYIPYNEWGEGEVVNDEYFVKVPGDRLITGKGMIRFRADGALRSKIGLSESRSQGICGCYDPEKRILTVVKILPPEKKGPYVNSVWGPQDDPYHGDVINAYNDGPLEDGRIMGPFCELECSSPALELLPGESQQHTQVVMHFSGEEKDLDRIIRAVFGFGPEILNPIFLP
ncbi:MAG: DUF6786 family protein [Bacteroidota bacterium]